MVGVGGKKEVTDVQTLMPCVHGGRQAALWLQSPWLREQPASRCASEKARGPAVVLNGPNVPPHSWSQSTAPQSAEGSEVWAGGSLSNRGAALLTASPANIYKLGDVT